MADLQIRVGYCLGAALNPNLRKTKLVRRLNKFTADLTKTIDQNPTKANEGQVSPPIESVRIVGLCGVHRHYGSYDQTKAHPC